MLLVAGGSEDPNLDCVTQAAAAAGVACTELRTTPTASPCLSWDMVEGRLTLDRELIQPTGLFIRHDAFAGQADPRPAVEHRALAWFVTIQGWAMAHPRVRLLNRGSGLDSANKPYVLAVASACGLPVPESVISTDMERLEAVSRARPMVAKPVAGGDYCIPLQAALDAGGRSGLIAPAPAIAQEQLIAPEIRIYVVGETVFAFRVDSEALDYRTDPRVALSPVGTEELPETTVSRLLGLMQRLGLDFGAADFKTRRDTGELCLLEVNNQPMFAAFDAVVGGALSDAIVSHLCAAPRREAAGSRPIAGGK